MTDGGQCRVRNPTWIGYNARPTVIGTYYQVNFFQPRLKKSLCLLQKTAGSSSGNNTALYYACIGNYLLTPEERALEH